MFATSLNKPQGGLLVPLTGFGSGTSQQQNAQQPSTSIFGSSNLGQTTTTPSLFGSTTVTQPQQTGFGFGASQQQQQQQLQQSQQQQQQQQQQHAQQAPDLTLATKFNDLPDAMRQQFEQFDAHIQKQIQISDELKIHSLSTEPEKGSRLLRQVSETLADTTTTLRDDELFAQDLKTRVDQTVADVVHTTRIIEGFRNPREGGGYLTSLAGFPFDHFSRLTEQMRERLQRYKITVEQIERKIASISNATHSQLNPQAISNALRAQHGLFMTLAARTAELETVMKQLKTAYIAAWRAQTGSARDPFAAGGDGGKGLDRSRLG
ncbi:hypothetical protein BOTBODRAFT_33561 [Botryobasidium botryosum FD-172 SS1]|uniref:Nucleoporin Nup54 alpha-helical domain-containing protein n=1 Tax=Botryobasidium botryosum (strain FD-172 SS1) TaxID=930990 RepID=A0A067MNT6_BOTB1|nr:hypothetical protein BOTBODRAFT_33561 [Botryobasidium botryosum FD-172 SS1]